MLGGYILSVWIGLFGFKEVRTTGGIVAGIFEVAAFGALAAYALIPTPARDSGQAEERAFSRIPASAVKAAGLAAAGLAVLALVLFGVSVAGAAGGASAAASSGGGGLKTTTIGGAKVLDQRQGPHSLLVRRFLTPRRRQRVLRQLRRVLAPGQRDLRPRGSTA